MSAPVRVQLRRTKGWRMPPNTVVVARPSKWGNPYRIERDEDGPLIIGPGERLWNYAGPWGRDATTWGNVHARAVELFRCDVGSLNLSELRGKNLACWCPLDQPCHADVLLELANSRPLETISSAPKLRTVGEGG